METYRYPITFSKKNEYEASDFRFIECTIDVMHTGRNLNKSSFSKECIENAISTIANTPILGYIEMNKDGVEDFKGHEHELKIDEDGIKYVYSGSAYGVIPESCNPRWITKDDGHGEMRDYLEVDGLLWSKFDAPYDIFKRDGCVKNHSVELTEMLGDTDQDGYYNVQSFKFDGCCILSTTDPMIQPAMSGSNIVANFSADTIAAQIKDRLNEFSLIKLNSETVEQNSLKGELMQMEPENIIEEIVEQPIVEEEVAPTIIEEPIMEQPVVEEEPAVEEPTPEKPQLTLEQKLHQIMAILEAECIPAPWDEEDTIPHYQYRDIQDDEIIVMDNCDWNIVGLPYTMVGDNVVIDFENARIKKIIYADWNYGEDIVINPFNQIGQMFEKCASRISDEKNKCMKVTSEYEAIKPKYDEYVAAEVKAAAEALQAKRNNLFSLLDDKLSGNAEYEALKQNNDIDYSELETKCYALYGRASAEFSYVPSTSNNQEVHNVRFGVIGSQKISEGAYGDLFERYGVRK